MSVRFHAYHHLRRILVEPAEAINPLFYRAATVNRHPDNYPEHNFPCYNSQLICDDENQWSFNEFELFLQLQKNGSSASPYFFNRVISACAKPGSLFMGLQLHCSVIKLGFDYNVFINSALVDLYCKCGTVSSAQNLFDKMPDRNVVTWNSLISGYLHNQIPNMAIGMFLEMLKRGMIPTPFTFSAVLVACSQLEAEELGIQVHGLGLKAGFCSNVVVGTGLIDMYSKCSNVDDSRRVFDRMPDRNVVTWTSMVTSYAQNQQPDEAMILVREMARFGVRLNNVTYNSLLSSFSNSNDLDHGKQVHCQVILVGMESHAYLVVTLMTMYSECGNLEDFCKICSAVSLKDQISWNSVISGFSHLGKGLEALKHFVKMRQACVAMDFFTFSSALRATGILSALEEGKQTHALVLKTGYASNVNVQNGLVSMYARCGAIQESKQVFSLMNEPDLVSWNSLLSGCSQHGYGTQAVELFEQMRRIRIRPDQTTFLTVLSACSHVGFVDKGLEYFELMRHDDLLEPPKVEHYACMVDLFGRAGHLDEAESFIKSMPMKPGPSVYKALLSACQVHGNVDIAIRSAKNLLELCPNDPSTYVLLSNVLATGSYWDDAAEIRKLMYERGVRKKPGRSWIEVNKDHWGRTSSMHCDLDRSNQL